MGGDKIKWVNFYKFKVIAMSYILLYFSIEFISKIRNNQHLLS